MRYPTSEKTEIILRRPRRRSKPLIGNLDLASGLFPNCKVLVLWASEAYKFDFVIPSKSEA
jgi:hypothetical protein